MYKDQNSNFHGRLIDNWNKWLQLSDLTSLMQFWIAHTNFIDISHRIKIRQ